VLLVQQATQELAVILVHKGPLVQQVRQPTQELLVPQASLAHRATLGHKVLKAYRAYAAKQGPQDPQVTAARTAQSLDPRAILAPLVTLVPLAWAPQVPLVQTAQSLDPRATLDQLVLW